MLRWFVLFTFLFSFSTISASEEISHKCALQRPFLYGASISAGYGGIHDGIAGLIAAKAGSTYSGSQDSPTRFLQKKWFPKNHPATNISEIVNVMSFGGFGHRQFFDYIKTSANIENLKKSSAIVSLDAFYWPAAFGWCSEASQGAVDIIAYAKRIGVPTILANVPLENPNNVDLLVQTSWKAPQPDCLAFINKTLKDYCTAENNCYLIDLYAVVNRLNNNEVGVQYKGKTYTSADMRFDGVHLNKLGTEYVGHLIEEALKENPPQCTHPSDG